MLQHTLLQVQIWCQGCVAIGQLVISQTTVGALADVHQHRYSGRDHHCQVLLVQQAVLVCQEGLPLSCHALLSRPVRPGRCKLDQSPIAVMQLLSTKVRQLLTCRSLQDAGWPSWLKQGPRFPPTDTVCLAAWHGFPFEKT